MNADKPGLGTNNRAWTGKEIIEREPRHIGLIQVLRNPMEVCRNQASRYEPAVCDTGAASAHCSRNSEFNSFGRHG
jgi:hypothetical protein